MPWYCIDCGEIVKPFTTRNVTYLEWHDHDEHDLPLEKPTKVTQISKLRTESTDGPYCPLCFHKKELVEKEDNLVLVIWRKEYG